MDLGPINLSDPVEWTNPVLKGLKAWWTGLPGQPQPGVLWDIVRPGVGGQDGTFTGLSVPGTATSGWGDGPDGFPALRFDGSGDYVTLPSTIDSFPTNEATLALWLRRRVATPAAAQTGGWRLTTTSNINDSLHYPWTDGAGYINTFLNSRVGPITLSTAVTRTNWHLVTITSTPGAGGWAFYQNNIQVTTSTGQATINLDEAGGLWLGKSNNPTVTAYEFDGQIASAMLWTRALSAGEVRYLWQQFARGRPNIHRRDRPQRRMVQVITPPAGGGPMLPSLLHRPSVYIPGGR